MKQDSGMMVKNTFYDDPRGVPEIPNLSNRSITAPVKKVNSGIAGNKMTQHYEDDYPEEEGEFVADMPQTSFRANIDEFLEIPTSPPELNRLVTGDSLFNPSAVPDPLFPDNVDLTRLQTGDDFNPSTYLDGKFNPEPPQVSQWNKFDPQVNLDNYSSPDLQRLVTCDPFNDDYPVSSDYYQNYLDASMPYPAAPHIASPIRIPDNTNFYNTSSTMIPPMANSNNPTPRAPEAEALVEAPMPRGMTRFQNQASGEEIIEWKVEGKKLKSTDKQQVSPAFTVRDVPFKLLLFPVAHSDLRGGASFKNSGGKGYLQMKCEAVKEKSNLPLQFSFYMKNSSSLRGPVTNDFFSKTVEGLPKNQQQWNLLEHEERGFLVVGLIIKAAQ